VNQARGPVFESVARIEPCYSHTVAGVSDALAPKRRSASRDFFGLGVANGAVRAADRARVRDERARTRGGSVSARRRLPRTAKQPTRQQEQRSRQRSARSRLGGSDVAACRHCLLPNGGARPSLLLSKSLHPAARTAAGLDAARERVHRRERTLRVWRLAVRTTCRSRTNLA